MIINNNGVLSNYFDSIFVNMEHRDFQFRYCDAQPEPLGLERLMSG